MNKQTNVKPVVKQAPVTSNNTPVNKIRAGAISATEWKNQAVKDGETQEYTTVTFERSYKDKEGNWKTTNSLRVNDLPKAIAVLQQTYNKLILKEFNGANVSHIENALEQEIDEMEMNI